MGSASVDEDWSSLSKWLIKKRLEGKSVTAICAEAQVDRKMFYRWWSRYQAHGWKGLEEKARGRPVGPGIDDSLKQKVIKLRKRYEWGPNKIAGCLNRKGFSIDHNQAYHIICDAGLNHPISEPRKTWGTKRFQRTLQQPLASGF
jgi:transposase